MVNSWAWVDQKKQVITALRAALAEPEKNPFGDDAERYSRKLHEEREYYKALFTAPTPQPEQKPVAHLWQHGETGRTRIIGNDEVWTASNQWFCVGPLYLGSAPTPRKPQTTHWEGCEAVHPECKEKNT